MNEGIRNLLLDWMRKIHQLEYAHTYESIKWSTIEKFIGISAFVISTLIACSYRFPGMDKKFIESLPFYLKHEFIIPLFSTILAILTGLQTFLKPNEKSNAHRKTANEYEKLRHRIEPIFVKKLTEWEINQQIETIRKDWEKLDLQHVSNKNFYKGKKRAQSFNKYPEELGFLPSLPEKEKQTWRGYFKSIYGKIFG